MNLSREQIVELVILLESKVMPEKWILNGVNVWPWVRVKLYFYLIKKIERKESIELTIKKLSTFEKLNRVFSSLVEWIRLSRIWKSDILFVSASELRDQYEGISYNKFFDPLRSSNEFKRCILIETSDLPSNAFLKDNNLSFSRLQTVSKLFNFFGKSRIDTAFWNEFNALLAIQWKAQSKNLDAIDFNTFIGSLAGNWEKVIAYKRVWAKILTRVAPSRVFTLWYYSDSIYGLNLAASEKGISTIETQHGPISDFHLAYGAFQYLDKSISHSPLLPKAFLVWNKNTYDILVRSLRATRVDVLGMPWFDFMIRKSKPLNPAKKFILYALQPAKEIGPLFPQTLVKMMRDSSEEFDWFIRLHPRQMMEYHAIKTELEEYRLPNVEIDVATRTPLPIVLDACSMVFTNFSGVALEAIQIGKPVIAINPIAKLCFQEEINDHLVFACDLKHDTLSWSQLKKDTEVYFNTVNESRINSLEMFKAYCAN